MKLPFINEEDAGRIVEEQKSLGYVLMEIQNTTLGNFLVFNKKNQNIDTKEFSDYIVDVDYRVTMIELGL